MKPRLDTPRVGPLDPSDWTEDQAKLLKPVLEAGQVYNNLGTQARHQVAFSKTLIFAGHIRHSNTLSDRQRELVILRTGWLCRSEYVWKQHRVIAQREGLPVVDIDRVAQGPQAPDWSPADRALLAAVDELVADHFITDPTWAALSEHLSVQQIMDIVFTSGMFVTTAALLNSLGVQLDATFSEDPKASVIGLVYPA